MPPDNKRRQNTTLRTGRSGVPACGRVLVATNGCFGDVEPESSGSERRAASEKPDGQEWVESSPPHWSGPVADGGTTHSRREVQLSNPLLTLAVAPDDKPDVGFLARTVSTPAVGEWLQPLRSGTSLGRGEGLLRSVRSRSLPVGVLTLTAINPSFAPATAAWLELPVGTQYSPVGDAFVIIATVAALGRAHETEPIIVRGTQSAAGRAAAATASIQR